MEKSLEYFRELFGLEGTGYPDLLASDPWPISETQFMNW